MLSSKENINPDDVSKQIASLSIDDDGDFDQNAQSSPVDEIVNTAPLTTIHRLPTELWVKIVELALMEDSADQQHIKLSRLIGLSHICQFTWYARLNKYFYAKIDMVSGFVKDKQADVLSAYMKCITNKTRLIKFGDSGPDHEASTTLIVTILSTPGCGDKASRVHFLGNQSLTSSLSSTTVDALAKHGRRLTHLHVLLYQISYPMFVRNLLDTSSADQLITLQLDDLPPQIDDVDSDIQLSMRDFRKCGNLRNLIIEENIPWTLTLSIDLDDIILHLPQLEYVIFNIQGSITVDSGGRAPKGRSTALHTVNLRAHAGVTWTVPPQEFLKLCPYLEDVDIANWRRLQSSTLNMAAVFDGCTHLKYFSVDGFNLTVSSLTTWPASLEEITVLNMNCVEFLYAIGNMAKRLQGDGRPVLVSRLILLGSSSTADSLRICLTHMPMLTHLSLDYHNSIKREHQRWYIGREEIDNLLNVLDTIYVGDEDVE